MIKKWLTYYYNLSVNVKAAIWYTFANIMQKAVNVLFIPIYTRLLSPSEYGTYSVFISWMEIFEIVVTCRLFYGAYVVGLVKYQEDRESYTSSLERLSVIITTFFLVFYLLFQTDVNAITELTTSLTLLLFIMMYIIPVMGFWRAWQRVDNQYVKMVIVTSISTFLTPVLGMVGVVFVKANANTIIYARVCIEIMVALAILFACKKMFFSKMKSEYCKYALSMNIPLIPYYLSMVVLNHSDRIMIQKLCSYSEAGIYSVAYSAAMVMTLFTNAFNSSIQPWLFKELKLKNYKRIPGILNAILMLIAVLNLILIAIAPEVIFLLAPKQYQKAVWIIPPLAVSVYVMAFYQNFINVEFYYNESKITALASVGAAIINIGLNVVFIPRMGFLAAGYTTLACYVIFFLTHYLFVKKVCKRNHCPYTIFGLKNTMQISGLFLLLSVVMAIGYQTSYIRYSSIILILICLFVKRNYIKKLIKVCIVNRG